MKRFPTRKLTAAALFVAMSIVLTRMLSLPLENFARLSAGNIPIFVASLWLGPFFGGAAGVLADFLGTTLFPMQGGWYPPLALGPLLTGVLPGLFVWLTRQKNLPWWQILCLVLCCNILTEVLWKALALHWLFGPPWLTLILWRAPFNAIQTGGEIVLLTLLLGRLGLRPRLLEMPE